MYFKLDESLAHRRTCSSNFLLQLAMQLQKHIWISRVVEWMKCMSNWTDKFVPGITLFVRKLSCLSWLRRSTNVFVWLAVNFRTIGKAKTVKKFIGGKLIYGHLIMSSCLVRCWLTTEWHLGLASCLLYRNFLFNSHWKRVCTSQVLPMWSTYSAWTNQCS